MKRADAVAAESWLGTDPVKASGHRRGHEVGQPQIDDGSIGMSGVECDAEMAVQMHGQAVKQRVLD